MAITLTTPYQQILDKGAAQLQQLDKAQVEATAKLRATQAEQETLEARAHERATAFTACFNTSCSLLAEFESLKAQVRLAENTLAAGKLVGQLKAAERESGKASEALDKLQVRQSADEAHDLARSAQLDKELVALRRQLAEITAERTTLQDATSSAQRDMGVNANFKLVESVQLSWPTECKCKL